ncbi:hypothetical protein PF006_g1266 [Phytophthora fragariae]|uniref:Uncharacterized protein n=1 Tax=Phytophthora fragariae TaxID=53985 RepID=A0A6A3V5L0_9STRA|nr:hypothetical protein PF006_g1266 [Phytophthora fragariae]
MVSPGVRVSVEVIVSADVTVSVVEDSDETVPGVSAFLGRT